jgi:hypothetical protein
MAVDFKTFAKIVPHVTKVKKPVLIRGKHGIGKSEQVYQFAAAIGFPVIERRASQMTEGDLIGLPSLDGNRTRWNPPDWYKTACEKPVVLFFDEVDRAVTEVRQGLFELTDSRKLNGFHLHPDTLIFAAVNGGQHGSQYQVGEMDPAELDRWTVFDLEPTVEDFLDFAKDKLNMVVWDFINQNRVHLEHKGEFEPNKVYPSRRSWFRLNECLTSADMLGKEKNEQKQHLPAIYELGCAFIGMEGAVALRDFVEKYERQISIDDIFNGKHDALKSLPVNDHLALIEKIQASDKLKSKLDAKTLKNISDYIRMIPAEASMKLWKIAGNANVYNAVELHKLCNDYIVSIMTGGSNKK